MKRLIPGLFVVGLMSIPVQAKADFVEDFFGGISGGAAARGAVLHTGSRHGGHHARAERRASRVAIHGAGSFTAMTSWYGGGPRSLEPNTHTANGERFNKWGLTAAHRTLPLGTRLLLSHGGRSVVVRVNDRGPAAWTGRSLDVSKGAATRLGLIQSGTGRVSVTVLASR
ncbi:MAG: septal ring lytic transglycosylase RlpA family protein [Methylocystis sp.]